MACLGDGERRADLVDSGGRGVGQVRHRGRQERGLRPHEARKQGWPNLITERFTYYRKSVMHLLKHMFHVHLSRCSTYFRKYTIHPV